ncbi:MAG: aspartate-semialdehyde dehydrogenase [Gammaproteobacteria bacterium]
MATSYNIAIIGATGIVGSTTLSILEERKFPVNKIFLLASKRSAGDTVDFKGKPYFVEDLAEFDFSQTQICFFCAGNDVSEEYAPKAAALGNVVIDKSSHFRYDDDVPLVVPEVNEAALKKFSKKNIIASPNCNTIPVVVALKPIYDAVGIARINIATYQSVSGTGKDAVTELAEQTAQLLNGLPVKPKIYSQQIAFNVLPHCDEMQENGYTREEMKIVWETHKILNDKKIAINATAVRVPVFFGHSAAVHIETKEKITMQQALDLLANAPGIKLATGKHQYPSPVHDAAGKDEVFVGRVREDISHKKGLNLWVVADNLRKGAALNAVQIAEKLIEKYL